MHHKSKNDLVLFYFVVVVVVVDRVFSGSILIFLNTFLGRQFTFLPVIVIQLYQGKGSQNWAWITGAFIKSNTEGSRPQKGNLEGISR